MIKGKSTFAIAISAAMILSFSACGDGGSSSAASTGASGTSSSVKRPQPTDVPTACKVDGKTLTIGVVSIDEQTAFFNQLNTGIKDVATIAGAKINFVSGKDDAATQVTGIENLMSSKVSALIVDPYDMNALVPAFKSAKAAGIPVVSVDGQVADASSYDAQVGTANKEGGAELASTMLKLSGGKGAVGIVGALNSTIQIQRQEGFEDAVKAGGMTISTVVDGQNQADKAQTAAENLLTANPNLKYIYATGEPALNGAIAAVKSQGRQNDVQIVGWDLSQTSASALTAGFVKAVVQQNSFGFGQESAKAAINLACGKTVKKDISVPINIVTSANLKKYSYFLKES
ncbi:MAG: substrate-binding domain-containing protein [Bifidobacterium sp.]|uniref:substrate-binding domain-containing protein n=1 Tax=Bifidobacterium sp. TaxID=41200 RepID=UPI0039EC1F91